jgi:broad specificity phosphatase PhoE
MPEAVRLGFLRHGEVTGPAHVYRGADDPPLSAQGWAQMREFVAAVPGWQAVVSSPAQRCAAFARTLAAEHALPLALDADWREFGFGDWEGLRPDEVAARAPAAHAAFVADPRRHPPPGGETLDAFDARIRAALQKLGDAARAPTLIVAHAGALRAVLAAALNLDDTHRARVALTPGSGFVLSWLVGQPPLLMELRCAA